MAWMRVMGADSVDYHRLTIAERSDDFPGQALAYYASRGETPLVWGGSGASALGLQGNVTDAQYEAIYGPGGAADPTTGARLVATRRPGLELVVAAHKSVAELGVIGLAEDMHLIMDAERDATLAYLDDVTRARGGRRGRERVATPTDGLVYVTTRHATSRAGDPAPHDHVLLANVVAMGDERGGFKAADTTLWRDHLHAATMVGRVAAAARAVEMGYAIVPDTGRSGRLGHWAIDGIPDEAMEVHSKRAAEIDAEIARRGHDSYRARQVAARTTRAPKRHEPVGNLMPRWHAELESVGWPLPRLRQELQTARLHAPVQRWLYPDEVAAMVAQVLEPGGPLAARKVFSRRDVIVAAAPALFGQDPGWLQAVVDRVIADPEVVPLIGVDGARERAYATATVIAREQAIAGVVATQVERLDAAAVDVTVVERAVAARERVMGSALTVGQRQAVIDIATSGRGVDLVVGVAGAGKTTALSVLREAYEAEGCEVVGTSTSGQAARTLGRQAGLATSRTLASLTWRLDHGKLALGSRSVVILDEAAMTDDAGLLRLLAAADDAGAKVVMVGDFRQLGAVGPGGGFESLVARHGPAVHVLDENVRQRDAAERVALGELRDGHVAAAVEWYVDDGRVVTAADHDAALDAVVTGWAGDVAAGKDAVMLAWRRSNVAELTARGRELWESLGRLGTEELVAPGGARYAVGDRVVTLAPGAGGEVVTSETGTVVAVDTRVRAMVVRMDDDGCARAFGPTDIGADRLAHGYAITVHRAQGSTVDVAHALEDGGGRELAYVKMSRARESSHVYVVADALDQAAEDLARDWSTERRLGWAIDSGTPALDPAAVEADDRVAPALRAVLRQGRLQAERAALEAAIPPDPIPGIVAAEAELERVRLRQADLAVGRGVYADGRVGRAARNLAQAEAACRRLQASPPHPLSLADRRSWKVDVRRWEQHLALAVREWETAGRPEALRLELLGAEVEEQVIDLRARRTDREVWLSQHPEVGGRLKRLNEQVAGLALDLDQIRVNIDATAPAMEIEPPDWLGRDLDGPGIGMDIGL